jgi:hypothetical protein
MKQLDSYLVKLRSWLLRAVELMGLAACCARLSVPIVGGGFR